MTSWLPWNWRWAKISMGRVVTPGPARKRAVFSPPKQTMKAKRHRALCGGLRQAEGHWASYPPCAMRNFCRGEFRLDNESGTMLAKSPGGCPPGTTDGD